ncbi:MAG: alpha/beta fold hydrolase [Candidatus Heimdallarchaeota archaeon]
MQPLTMHIDSKIQLSYYYRKSNNGLTLIFIHGLGCSKNDYLGAFSNHLLKEYGLLAVDLVGHYDSSTPSNFTYAMNTQARVLKKLIQKLALADDCVLICHSMGGPVGVHLAEILESKIKGMIYAEGNIDENDCFFSLSIIEQYTIAEWKKIGFATVLNSIKEMAEEDSDLLFAKSFAKAGPITTYKSSLDLVSESRNGRLLERLTNLEIPILAIFGEDNKGKFSSESKLKKKFPISYIPNSRHAMMHHNPVIFYEVILGFLNKFK